MEQPIMKDPIFLAQKSEPATAEELGVAQDLPDAPSAHCIDIILPNVYNHMKKRCLGSV